MFEKFVIDTTETMDNMAVRILGRFDCLQAAKKAQAEGRCVVSDGVFGHYVELTLVPVYEDEDVPVLPMSTAMACIFERPFHKSYELFEKIERVELKNWMQDGFAMYGWKFAEYVRDLSVFGLAFYEACLDYNGGTNYARIPDAETIFAVYGKIIKRRNYVW